MGVILLVAVATVMLPSLCQASNDNSMFYYQSIEQLGDPANLSCVYEPTNNTVDHWVLEDNTVMDASTTGISRVSLSDDMMTLHIPKVDENLLGIYLCSMTTADGKRTYSRTDLYLYKEDLWDVYKKNVYVGLIAAGIMLVLVSVLCLLQNYKWSDRGQNNSYEVTEVPMEQVEFGSLRKTNGELSPVDGYANPGYAAVEPDVQYQEKGGRLEDEQEGIDRILPEEDMKM